MAWVRKEPGSGSLGEKICVLTKPHDGPLSQRNVFIVTLSPSG